MQYKLMKIIKLIMIKNKEMIRVITVLLLSLLGLSSATQFDCSRFNNELRDDNVALKTILDVVASGEYEFDLV